MSALKNRIFIVILAVVFALTFTVQPVSAASGHNGRLMQKYLKAYKAKHYRTARKLSRKMPKYGKEPCVGRMSSARKTAYRKIVKRYIRKYGVDPTDGTSVWGCYLTDLDGDGDAELIVDYGSCEADRGAAVYEYRGKGKVRKVTKRSRFGTGHITFSAYPNHAGVVMSWMHMGGEAVSRAVLRKGKLKITMYGSRTLHSSSKSSLPRMFLDGHIRYDDDYNAYFSYKDFR